MKEIQTELIINTFARELQTRLKGTLLENWYWRIIVPGAFKSN